MSDQDDKVFHYRGGHFRQISDRWTWLEEYALMGAAQYQLACPADRVCEFGSGVFASGVPQGTRDHFSGLKQIHVLGIGSIHVRVTDGKGPCMVGLTQQALSLRSGDWQAIQEGYSKLHGS